MVASQGNICGVLDKLCSVLTSSCLGNDHLTLRGGYGFLGKNIMMPNFMKKKKKIYGQAVNKKNIYSEANYPP